MKTRPRPKTKLPKLVEIFPDMYQNLFFGDISWKPLKISEKGVHMPAFSKYSFITPLVDSVNPEFASSDSKNEGTKANNFFVLTWG